MLTKRVFWMIPMVLIAACGSDPEARPETQPEAYELLGKSDLAKALVLTTDASSYLPGQAVQGRLENNYRRATVFLPGCVAWVVQKNVGGAWVDQPAQVLCWWEGFARAVLAGSSHVEPVGPLAPGSYRLKASTKRLCQQNATFSQCDPADKTLVTTYSRPFTVGAKTTTIQSACKASTLGYAAGTIQASVQGSQITISHLDALYNCVARVRLDVGFSLNGDIVATEVIENPDEAAFCFCPFDLSVQADVSGLAPGVHTVQVFDAEGGLVGTASVKL